MPDLAAGQVRYSGQAYAMAYAWEAPAGGDGQLDTYQGLRLRIRPSGSLDARTHLRFAQRGDSTLLRAYQLYADAQISGRTVTARLGRQFMYRGTVNGTFDALSVRIRPEGGWDVQALVGISAPYSRKLELADWDEGGSLGLFAGKSIGESGQANVSYFQRRRGGVVAWQIAGIGLSVQPLSNAYMQYLLDYNLKQSAVQRMRSRFWVETGQWIFSAEVNTQRPQVFENSYFAIFDLAGYSQARIGASYNLGPARLGYQFIGTSFEEGDSSGESVVSVGTRWGTVGFVYQKGYGGDRLSLYADARVDVTPALSLNLHSSYLEYERRSVSLSEDATAFSAGLQFRPNNRWWIQVDAQRSMNSVFDHDTRLLTRAGYAF